MKILQVNKFHYPRGGADKYFLDLVRLQQEAGHEVAVFSMRHPKNLPSPWQKYFISRISFNNQSLADKLKTPGRVLYSLEARKKFSRLLDNFKPDIIHIHNIYHHISPSILDEAYRRNIDVVMHLHDYKLICANHSLFTEGQVCQACRPDRYLQCLKRRCVKGSLSASALAVGEMFLHHSVLKIYEKKVKAFIAPSHFMKEIAVSFGQPSEKIKVIFNPYSPELDSKPIRSISTRKNDYLLYFGRLSPEKGIETLIKAADETGYKLKIAGQGESEKALRELSKRLKNKPEFLGLLEGEDLKDIISSATAVVIPSIWYENMPLSLMEAMRASKIVIASRIGGLPEIIKDGQNGLLFQPGSVKDLADKIKSLDKIDKTAISIAARETVSQFSPETNLKKVMGLYAEILS